jgi:hypothetical protein
MLIILATQEANSAQTNSLQDPISKISNPQKAGRVAQVVECLPSKFKSGVQTLVPPKKKKLKKICSYFKDSTLKIKRKRKCSTHIQWGISQP